MKDNWFLLKKPIVVCYLKREMQVLKQLENYKKVWLNIWLNIWLSIWLGIKLAIS
ncbi:hypothetical protein [Lactococcus formosensis]|uniref:hypothetical protein n=1 Tax=Lactococcus formosensis TaxID=1281486 RepID=UPI002434DA6D|nr:hypothetical protein [Lactococcus formosensis]MDG6131403.1 hypothetical protein [Lactococcus formosensis]